MPIKPHPLEPETVDPPFANELEKVIAVVQQAVAHSPADGEALAIVRPVSGLSYAAWEKLAQQHQLAAWLGVPLNKDLHASMALLADYQKRLALKSDLDPLTQIGNKGYFTRHLHKEFSRAIRSKTDISLVVLDIDDFKYINDTYGHLCGDMVLRELAAFVRKSIRDYDRIARIGGEEFAVILPATGKWTAQSMAERIQERLRQKAFQWEGARFTVTFSAGVSSLAQLERHEQKEDTLIDYADKAMYTAKAQGKDQVSVAFTTKSIKDKSTLVQQDEKKFLFTCDGAE